MMNGYNRHWAELLVGDHRHKYPRVWVEPSIEDILLFLGQKEKGSNGLHIIFQYKDLQSPPPRDLLQSDDPVSVAINVAIQDQASSHASIAVADAYQEFKEYINAVKRGLATDPDLSVTDSSATINSPSINF